MGRVAGIGRAVEGPEVGADGAKGEAQGAVAEEFETAWEARFVRGDQLQVGDTETGVVIRAGVAMLRGCEGVKTGRGVLGGVGWDGKIGEGVMVEGRVVVKLEVASTAGAALEQHASLSASGALGGDSGTRLSLLEVVLVGSDEQAVAWGEVFLKGDRIQETMDGEGVARVAMGAGAAWSRKAERKKKYSVYCHEGHDGANL